MANNTDSQDDEFVITPSFDVSELSDNNELQITIYQNKRKALTIQVNIETIHALIKEHLFGGSTGEIKYSEYDADPEKGGKLESERLLNIQEALNDPHLRELLDVLTIDSILYVLKALPVAISTSLASLEYEAALSWAKNAEEKIKEEGYLINNKVIKLLESKISLDSPSGKEIAEQVIKIERDLIKRRLDLKGRGGSEGWWNKERRAKFLELYEDVHKKVKAKSSELPSKILNKLHLRGEKPSDIALMYAAELFDVEANEYLPRVLTRARSERKKTTLKQGD